MRVSDLAGARVGLWGAGREAAATFRALGGAAVVATDPPVDAADRARFPGATFAHGDGALEALRGCEVVVRSPGISRYRDEVAALRDAGVALTTATNLWLAEHGDEHVIAVTGTKGKSTTASLVHRLVTAAGARAELAGNIGRPLLDVAPAGAAPDLWVIELSSYQTADLERAPEIAVVVNLSREHLDWHGSDERYYADKLNLLRQGPRVAVLNGRDALLLERAGVTSERALAGAPASGDEAATDVVRFGIPGGYDVRDGDVVHGDRVVVRMADTALLGEHNALNVAAALAAAEAAGHLPDDPQAAIAGFQPLDHRLQTVARDGELAFVDDSISTTPASAVAALRALAGGPVALLVGGQDRRQDFAPLADAIAEHGDVRLVIGLPDNGHRALDAIAARNGGAVATRAAADLDEAVRLARAALPDGGTVLLSPAAPSYGRFRDFAERGERFRAAALGGGAPA